MPSRTDTRDGLTFLQWDYAEPSGAASIPLAEMALLPVVPLSLLTGGSVSFTRSGDCHVIATSQAGQVTALHYSGDSDGITGRDAVCGVVVRGCLRP